MSDMVTNGRYWKTMVLNGCDRGGRGSQALRPWPRRRVPVRKREVVPAAVEGALQDGVVTERERDLLVRLEDQLGLSGTQARDIERQTVAGVKGVA